MISSTTAFSAAMIPLYRTTALKSGTIIGHTGKGGVFRPQYFTFSAGPGTIKLRLTLRPNINGVVGFVSLQERDGRVLARVGDGTSHHQDLTKTTSVDVQTEKTLILKISGNAYVYGTHHTTVRVQIEGDVNLDKKAQPLTISLGR